MNSTPPFPYEAQRLSRSYVHWLYQFFYFQLAFLFMPYEQFHTFEMLHKETVYFKKVKILKQRKIPKNKNNIKYHLWVFSNKKAKISLKTY